MDNMDSSFKFPKLKGNENYDSWKVDISNALKIKGLWWVTSGKVKKPEISENELNAEAEKAYKEELLSWKDKNDRACALISITMERGPRAHIRKVKIATEIWSKLKDQYESDVMTLYLALKELTQSKQSDFKSIQEYADALKRVSIKCSNTGKEIPDWMLGYLFLLGLNEGLEPYVFYLIQTAKTNKASLNIDDMAVALSDHDKTFGFKC